MKKLKRSKIKKQEPVVPPLTIDEISSVVAYTVAGFAVVYALIQLWLIL